MKIKLAWTGPYSIGMLGPIVIAALDHTFGIGYPRVVEAQRSMKWRCKQSRQSNEKVRSWRGEGRGAGESGTEDPFAPWACHENLDPVLPMVHSHDGGTRQSLFWNSSSIDSLFGAATRWVHHHPRTRHHLPEACNSTLPTGRLHLHHACRQYRKPASSVVINLELPRVTTHSLSSWPSIRTGSHAHR